MNLKMLFLKLSAMVPLILLGLNITAYCGEHELTEEDLRKQAERQWLDNFARALPGSMGAQTLENKLVLREWEEAIRQRDIFTKVSPDDVGNIAAKIHGPFDLIRFSFTSKKCHDTINDAKFAANYYDAGIKSLNNKDLKAAKIWFLMSNKVKPLDSIQLNQIPFIVREQLGNIKYDMQVQTGNLLCVVDDPFFDSHVVAIFEHRAENQVDFLAQNNLGYLYLHGLGVKADIQRAIYMFSLTADKGYLLGLYNLAWVYDNKTMRKSEAFRLYVILASNGDSDLVNQLDSDDQYLVVVAQYMVGNMYLNGRGVAFDAQEGIKFLTLAANQGYSQAQYTLGWYLENGQYQQPDYEEAARLYTLASEQGNRDATRALKQLKSRLIP